MLLFPTHNLVCSTPPKEPALCTTWTTIPLLLASGKLSGYQLVSRKKEKLEISIEEGKKEKEEAQRDVTIPPSRCKLKWLADPRGRRFPVSPPRRHTVTRGCCQPEKSAASPIVESS
ncbi:uncharacterized protein TrAtP1_005677 [Trichoderma atroviride]|uniref:uncharacterized protein n=1 Tax=Hypocrea atroviridis TaxID=63577 RepID=UPI00332ACCE0|nr:hypothetical protein TrAtP1_005677 [Trichoderma atroviride]